MLISKIRLSNFKNFEQIEIDLSDMNVIVGANASGKSNFIEALQFIKDIKDFGIENAISLHGGIEYLQNIQLKGNKETEIKIHFKSNFNKPIKNEKVNLNLHIISIVYSICISLNDTGSYEIKKENFGYETVLYSENKIILGEYEFYINSNFGITTNDSTISHNESIILENGQSITISANEINPYKFSMAFVTFIDPVIPNKKSLLEQHSFLVNFDPLNFAIYDFDLKKAKESTPITGKAELERNGENLAIVIRNILSNKEKSRQFANIVSDVLPFIKELDVEKFYDKSLLFKVKESFNANMDIPSSLLSDGTISITAILIALFFEDKDLAIFEEPERGIHPALIAKLMQYYYQASEKKQVIITTHNPEILKHTRLEDLILVSRNDDGFATLSRPGEKEMVKAFLENDLGIDQLFIQNLLDA